MNKYTLAFLGFILFPIITHAQSAQDFVANFTIFLENVIVPFMMGLAFLFFAFNAIRFFVIGNTVTSGEGSKKKTVGGDRGKAKALALYGILAFVLIIIFWGIVNLVGSSTGLGGQSAPINDYCPTNGCI